jgi:hypothetical protein
MQRKMIVNNFLQTGEVKIAMAQKQISFLSIAELLKAVSNL